jgi:dihydrolipoamide dehydrogenase
MSDYQLIVIGAGPGGYTAALEAARLGLHTAVVERREVGGTCLNRGCIPTKTLLHASQVYRDAVDGSPAGVHAGDITFNLGEMFAYKRAVSEKLRGGIHALLKGAKVDLLEGTARIDAPGRVTVAGPEGDTVYTADRILAATGSVPVRPPIPGLDLPGVMTSDELLEGSDTLYESLVIMGGGVIGVEFATFYANLGCRVTLIEGMDRLLPTMDRELGQNLGQILKKQGVEVLTSAMVRRVEQTPEGLTVHVDQKGKEKAVSGEKVLCAIGRRPCWDGLFAPELVPETGPQPAGG